MGVWRSGDESEGREAIELSTSADRYAFLAEVAREKNKYL